MARKAIYTIDTSKGWANCIVGVRTVEEGRAESTRERLGRLTCEAYHRRRRWNDAAEAVRADVLRQVARDVEEKR